MGSERRPHNLVTRSSSAIGKLILIGVVHYSFVEKNRSSHFGFVSTSLRPVRTSVPQPVSKLTCRRCRSRQRTKKKAAEWNPPNRQADLGTHCSNHMVVVWLQQVEPGWCQLAKKICRGCPILWGGPGHHAPGYFLTTRRDPRGQKMKPEGKATLSSLRKWRAARKERVPTISKSG